MDKFFKILASRENCRNQRGEIKYIPIYTLIYTYMFPFYAFEVVRVSFIGLTTPKMVLVKPKPTNSNHSSVIIFKTDVSFLFVFKHYIPRPHLILFTCIFLSATSPHSCSLHAFLLVVICWSIIRT